MSRHYKNTIRTHLNRYSVLMNKIGTIEMEKKTLPEHPVSIDDYRIPAGIYQHSRKGAVITDELNTGITKKAPMEGFLRFLDLPLMTGLVHMCSKYELGAKKGSTALFMQPS